MSKPQGEALYHKQLAEAIKNGWQPPSSEKLFWEALLLGLLLGFLLNGMITPFTIPDGFTPQDFGYGERP